jgi:hypothetical protein
VNWSGSTDKIHMQPDSGLIGQWRCRFDPTIGRATGDDFGPHVHFFDVGLAAPPPPLPEVRKTPSSPRSRASFSPF